MVRTFTTATVALATTLLAGCGDSPPRTAALSLPAAAAAKTAATQSEQLVALGFAACPAARKAIIPVTVLVTDKYGHRLAGTFGRLYFNSSAFAPHAVIKPASINHAGTAVNIYYDGTPGVSGYFQVATGKSVKPGFRGQFFFRPGGGCVHYSPSVLLLQQNMVTKLRVVGSSGRIQQDDYGTCEDAVSATKSKRSATLFNVKTTAKDTWYCELNFRAGEYGLAVPVFVITESTPP